MEYIDLFPPSRGIYNPETDSLFNELLTKGRASDTTGWLIKRNTLSLARGTANMVDQTLDNSTNNKMMTDFVSSDRDDLIYVNGRSLRYINRGGSETEVLSTFLTSDLQVRLGWVKFRQHILIVTPDDGLHWYDPQARSTRKAGLAAPTTNLGRTAGAAGNLNGSYTWVYTFVNDRGHESDQSPVSNAITLTNQQADLTSIDVGPTGVTSRKIYRTVASGAAYLLVGTINDNTTTTFTDNIADTALGIQVEENQTVPVDNLKNIFATSSRVYLIEDDGVTLWASKIDPVTGLPNWEAYPTSLSLDIPFLGGRDSMQAGVFWDSDIYVFGRLSTHRVVGDVATGVTVQKALDMGVYSPFAVTITPHGIVFVNNSKQIMLYDGENLQNIGKEYQLTLDGMRDSVGPSGTEVSYDPVEDRIHVHWTRTVDGGAGGNDRGVIIDMEDFTATEVLWSANISYYSESEDSLYISSEDDSTIQQWPGGSYTFNASTRFTFFPWSPNPGNLVYVARLRMIVDAHPIVSNVPPTIRVEFQFDGSNIWEVEKFIDITSDDIVAQRNIHTTKIVDIPIYRSLRNIRLRVSPVNNTASLVGFRIHRIQALVDVLTEAKDDRKVKAGDFQ